MGKIVPIVAVIAAVAVNFIPGVGQVLSAAIVNTGLGAGISVGAGAALASTAVSAISLIGLASAASLIASSAPTIKQPSGPGSAVNSLQPVANAPIVYGRCRIGGPLTFYHARQDTENGDTVDYRYFVVTLAAHEAQEIEAIWLNNAAVTLNGSNMVTDGNYANACWIWPQTGAESDTPPSAFTSETGARWTNAHQGKGIAKLYIKFKMSDDVISQGLPSMTAIMKGRKDIYDPRTGTTGYSTNAILCHYNWMLTPRKDGGFGLSSDYVDWDFVAVEADYCDDDIALAAGGTEKRYSCSGYIDTGAGADTIRDSMLVGMAGDWTLSEGFYKAYAGVWRTPTGHVSADDIIGGFSYDPLIDATTEFNTVRGVFISEDNGWQPVEFPAQVIDDTVDGETLDVEFPFIKSGAMAQRVARILQRRSTMQRKINPPLNLRGLPLEPVQNVTIEHPYYPEVANLYWSIRKWTINPDFSIAIEAREESNTIYAWAAEDEPISVASQSLAEPNISTIGSSAAPTGLTATASGSSQIDISFTMTAGSATTWILYRSETNDIATATVVTTGTAAASASVNYSDTGLTTSTTYYYWVRVYNSFSWSSVSLSSPAGPASDTTS